MEPFSPLISVVVPAYNAQDTLRDTLRSAAAGIYRNIEIIVVDDGSTDRTFSIAEELAGRDQRIRILQRDNGGLSAALNDGFAAAQGDYIARLDADDLWHPAKLERQVETAVRNPELAFIYTFARYIDKTGRVIHDAPAQRFPRWALCRGIYESVIGGGSSAMMKRSAVEKAGRLDESFRSWEDLLLQLAISSRHPIGFVPERLLGYRVRPGSLSKDIDAMDRSWRAVRMRLREQFPKVPGFVHAWAHGTRCAMFAEGYAWKRRYVRSAAWLLEAFRHDPGWTSEFLLYRLKRLVKKAFSAPEPPFEAPRFLDCDPSKPLLADPLEHSRTGTRFARFEQARLRTLADLDERLAREGAVCVEVH